MDPMSAMAIMAALGYGKAEFIDKPREARDRKYAATVASHSPWTGMATPGIREHDTAGSTVQGGLTGLSLAQGWPAAAPGDQTPASGAQPDMSRSAWAPEGSTDPNNPPQTTMYDRTPGGYPLNGTKGSYADWLAMSADQSPRVGQGRSNYVTR